MSWQTVQDLVGTGRVNRWSDARGWCHGVSGTKKSRVGTNQVVEYPFFGNFESTSSILFSLLSSSCRQIILLIIIQHVASAHRFRQCPTNPSILLPTAWMPKYSRSCSIYGEFFGCWWLGQESDSTHINVLGCWKRKRGLCVASRTR